MSATGISPLVLAQRDAFCARFAAAQPFRHVVIDGFLEAEFAADLLTDFPAFDRGSAINEAGEKGLKSTVERVRDLEGPFALLDERVQSRAFLDFVGHVTSIPDLIYDPHYFGGGTHESLSGQELDPHVDFNRHPIEPWHRRLNLIVYLNPEWQGSWGGGLELHSNPRAPDDQVHVIEPDFNRCVIFETTEHSWHGFSRIAMPPDRAGISRKSIALYFYTLERPASELADPHSTIYVDRPLPDRFRGGLTLTDADVHEVQVLLKRRDMHSERLYRDLSRVQAELVEVRDLLGRSRALRLVALVRRALRRIGLTAK